MTPTFQSQIKIRWKQMVWLLETSITGMVADVFLTDSKFKLQRTSLPQMEIVFLWNT
jgi:membrane protease subunit (stomatin/prohibitin family)